MNLTGESLARAAQTTCQAFSALLVPNEELVAL
jgi:hypothetical protein